MSVEALAQEGHVVLPADCGGEVDAYAADGGCYGLERAGGALSPDEAFRASLQPLVHLIS